MIKDIIVNLGVSAKQGHAAEDYAISVAGVFGANVTGIAFVYDPISWLVYPLTSYGEIPAEVSDALKREQADLANKAADRFAKAAALAGVSAESATLRTSFAGSVERFGRLARYSDLAIVGQVEPRTNAYETNIAEGALFASGRPMIIVPYVHKEPLKLDRVMVCWDGGAAAARAIHDAIPLLERAGRIELVTIGGERGKQVEAGIADMGRHLGRRGLKVDVQNITKGHVDVVDALLSHAADTGADFMIMGGHGHSRVREFFLGSVTEAVLRSTKVPVLMAH
jgi:nucleotide-binding universal stress UspA family protein